MEQCVHYTIRINDAGLQSTSEEFDVDIHFRLLFGPAHIRRFYGEREIEIGILGDGQHFCLPKTKSLYTGFEF